MDYQRVAETVESFIRERTKEFNGGVIGLSGGVDSTVVAYLAVRAIGRGRVYGLVMPYYENRNTRDGIEVAETLGIKYRVIDIKPNVDSFDDGFEKKVTKENLMARLRMCWLYSTANDENMIVLCTSNKSEISIGYFTKYGDGGVDIEPIGDLYKTEVWGLAKFLGVPKKIIDKKPSADLSPRQTDEGDIGMGYFTLDKILKGQTNGIDPALVEKVEALIRGSRHKREMPAITGVSG